MNLHALKLIGACLAALAFGSAASAQSTSLTPDAVTFSFGEAFPSVPGTTPAGDAFDIDTSGFGAFVNLTVNTLPTIDSDVGEIIVDLIVNPENQATGFAIVLGDDDDAQFGGVDGFGEDFIFRFDLTGVETGSRVQLRRDLSSFDNSEGGPDELIPAFMQEFGDLTQNFGLTGVQFRNEGPADVLLSIDLFEVEVFDPSAPLFQLNGGSNFFTAGSFNDFTAFTNPDGNIEVNADTSTDDFGILGVSGFSEIDFDASTHELQVEARLLDGNTADSFNIQLRDGDGADNAEGLLVHEIFLFNIPADQLSEDEFTTITIPIDEFSALLDEEGDGDGVQNFGLNELLIAQATEEGTLNIEVASVTVVPILEDGVSGDFNGDGVVDAADFIALRDNTDAAALNGNGDGDGDIDSDDFEIFLSAFAGSASSASAPATAASVPEPATLFMLMAAVTSAVVRRKQVA